MLRPPHFWRTSLICALCAGLLTACGSTPSDLPSRTGFPGQTDAPDATTASTQDHLAPLDTQISTLDQALFAATRAALADGDWLAATLALPQLESLDSGSVENRDAVQATSPAATLTASTASTAPAASPNATSLWLDYYSARIALLRGNTQDYETALIDLKSQRLPDDLRGELLAHELEIASRNNDSSAQLQLSLQLLALSAPGADSNLSFSDSVWNAAQRLSHEDTSAARTSPNFDEQGWLDLATANALDSPLSSAAALTAWEAQYTQHLAKPHANALREAALIDAQTTNLTLILPLSGPLEKAGEAVSRGFIAAFFADQDANIGIDVIDSRRFENIGDAYTEAQTKGANVIVGPLGKRQVAQLLTKPDLTVPVLTLNRPEFNQGGNPNALLFSLAPEDEARQLAADAYAGGARRALLIRPEGEWGERMEAALAEHWRQLGGHIPAAAIYGKPSTHSNAIRDALGLEDSAKRSAALRSLFSEPIETVGRRRGDLDAIFLLSKTSDEARALKPLINYHYAGELSVYALSTADSGSDSTSLNRDLGGLRLLAMPWRMDEGALPGGDSKSSSAALHALGADAYALARRWWRMRSTATPSYFGLTAELHASPDGTLERRLNTAEFDRGTLRPR